MSLSSFQWKFGLHGFFRLVFFILGFIFVGIGFVGLYLPGLPGTVFFILAAACFARSSARAEAWLLNHPLLGPSLRLWRERGAIARPAKVLALSGMTFGLLASYFTLGFGHYGFWAIAVMIFASAAYVATRPGA